MASTRCAYQSTASNSSWIEVSARCRSIVSVESRSSGSCSPALWAMVPSFARGSVSEGALRKSGPRARPGSTQSPAHEYRVLPGLATRCRFRREINRAPQVSSRGQSTMECRAPAIGVVLTAGVLAACSSSASKTARRRAASSTTTVLAAPARCVSPDTGKPVATRVPGVASDWTLTSFDGAQDPHALVPGADRDRGASGADGADGSGLGRVGRHEHDHDRPVRFASASARCNTAGYNVLTWDPRGFGKSTGTVEIDSAELRGPRRREDARLGRDATGVRNSTDRATRASGWPAARTAAASSSSPPPSTAGSTRSSR